MLQRSKTRPILSVQGEPSSLSKFIMTLIMLFGLIWPALLFNEPIISPDTPAYFKAGDVAVRFMVDTLNHSNDRAAAGQTEPAEVVQSHAWPSSRLERRRELSYSK